ncbi:MAG TPA: hypothetical protein VFA51_13070 [Candidatus Udaeobacter sp.]|nr:hypothetical protein [Candidatus Udaeobacter sp.]
MNRDLGKSADMKCVALSIMISIGFASQALAVLRPLFPAKPAPPFRGGSISIGDHWGRHPGWSSVGPK